MIVLLGATGYLGSAFARMLEEMREPFVAISRSQVCYTEYGPLVEYLRSVRATFLINAAGYTGKPNVDACEQARADTLQGNTLFPLTLSHACQSAGIPWGHVSSGCIYSGAIIEDGNCRIEPNLMTPNIRRIVESRPHAVQGFRETDAPNFSFRQPPCSFYSGTKALAEEALRGDERAYLWRLRIPFNEVDGPRNFLSKLQRYPKIYDNVNSISHLGDFVRAAFELWKIAAPPGIYNITNPGWVTSREV